MFEDKTMTTALSSTEAEYMVASTATATQEALWINYLLEELGINI